MRIPIARESIPFVAGLVVTSVVAAVWIPWSSVVPITLLGFVLWFFRDPERVSAAPPERVLSPADGRIIKVDGPHISIFLNVFNVHVCRSPVAARIDSRVHTPGRFLAAFKNEASESNERTTLTLEGPGGRLIVVLVAGLVARRIVTWVDAGQTLERGQRLGLIRFGSRVDVELPAAYRSTVRVGDRVTGGLSEIARPDRLAADPDRARSAQGSDV